MKRILIVLLFLVLTLVAWLALRQSKTALPPIVPSNPLRTATNATKQTVTSSVPLVTTSTNALVRPVYIDEDHWNQLMLVRQMELERNQAIEFYARVVDQNEQPVDSVKLKLILTYVNEDIFRTTNFFQMNTGDEVSHKTIELTSDADGWIQFTNSKGYNVDVGGLSKEGYSAMRDYYGGELYELHGIRRTFGDDILMTNFYNPQKGYTFHLLKK